MSREPKTQKPCRDCGYLLAAGVRGCPRCAMNIEAEKMIERVFAAAVIIGAILIVAGVAVIYLVRR